MAAKHMTTYTASDIQTDYFRCIPVKLIYDDIDNLYDTIGDLKESKKGAKYSKTTLLNEMQRRNLIGFKYTGRKVLLETPYYYPTEKVQKLPDKDLVSEYVRTSELVEVVKTLLDQAYDLKVKFESDPLFDGYDKDSKLRRKDG